MINIAKLLKGCPKGMKLYSPLFGEVQFRYVDDSAFGIIVEDYEHCSRSFDKYGRYFTKYNNAECLLFPSKDCRTWEGWKLPVEPKFKVGDDIKTGNTIETIAEIDYATHSYYCESGRTIWFENQDLWCLVPKKHYAIANFKPFDKVLVRCGDGWNWECNLFSRYDHRLQNPFITCNRSYPQCIPFKGNEHLLGTTDKPNEEFINW